MMKKILICDDAPEILEVINIILSDNGYSVKTISDCNNIIKTIKDYKPDLILLDLWIKNCDGREISKLIRQEEEISNIPILFISALNELDKIANEHSVEGYIKKPFEINELLDTVSRTLDGRSEHQ